MIASWSLCRGAFAPTPARRRPLTAVLGCGPLAARGWRCLAGLKARVLDDLSGQLAEFKLPRTIDVIEALPPQANCELMKRTLEGPFWAVSSVVDAGDPGRDPMFTQREYRLGLHTDVGVKVVAILLVEPHRRWLTVPTRVVDAAASCLNKK